MHGTVHALDFLERALEAGAPPPLVVLFGGETFLKRLCLAKLREWLAPGGGADELQWTSLPGPTTEWRDVADELSTVSLFGGGGLRVVEIDEANKFADAHRDRLEDYLAKTRHKGVLILNVELWTSVMRLYKAVDKSGLQIECRPPETSSGKSKVPDEARVVRWLAMRGKTTHGIVVTQEIGRAILDLVGPEFGLLDQELSKLALFVEKGAKVELQLVHDVVGGWRTKSTWEMIDAALEGNAAEALRQLDDLIRAGQEPVALFGSISWSLRRFAAATRIFQQAERQGQRPPLAGVLEKAGFFRFPAGAIEKAEKQMIQIGRQRGGKLYQWLLEVDLALKGSHSTPDRARFKLEQLIMRLSRHLGPQAARR